MHSLQDPLKDYIFYPNRFLYVLTKKLGNVHLQATYDDSFMLQTFFSLVNNDDFVGVIHPLNGLNLMK